MHQAYQPPQRRRRFTDRKGFKFGCLPAIVIVWVIVIVSVLTDSSDDGKADAKPKATATAHADSIAERRNKTRKAAGLTLYPTGKARDGYLAALRSIDDWFVDDKGEMDAVENGVDQCDGLDGKRPVWQAQQRFGKNGPGGRKVSEAEAQQINKVVVKYICPSKG